MEPSPRYRRARRGAARAAAPALALGLLLAGARDASPGAAGAVDPGFRTLAAGATARLAGPVGAAWSTTAPGVAAVGADGTVTARAAGVAGIVARAGARADTTVVAVLARSSVLSTAFPDGSYRVARARGASLTVPITLDLSRLGIAGDLGAAQFELRFDPDVLRLDSVVTPLRGSTDHNLVEPGRVRFSFAATAPQAEARLTLAALTFRVLPDAPLDVETSLRLSHVVRPVTTTLAPIETPLSVGGRVRAVPR